jgi:hypothetical protein
MARALGIWGIGVAAAVVLAVLFEALTPGGFDLTTAAIRAAVFCVVAAFTTAGILAGERLRRGVDADPAKASEAERRPAGGEPT